ncbi:hypothetical protein B566_EDAN005881 [Ephemera danica]|nr:hypothetical protein B566_EDAN005881 [Ephemera danica]
MKFKEEKLLAYSGNDPKINNRLTRDRPREGDLRYDTNKGDDRSSDRHRGRSRSPHSAPRDPTMSTVARAPSPYSPTRLSPDSSPQHTPQYAPNIPPPTLIHLGMPPNLSQPPPLPGTLVPSIPPPIIPPGIPPPVLLTPNVPPPSTTGNMSALPPMVNLPPPTLLATQPPPLLQVPSMTVPPPNMSNPPPALPNSLQPPQFFSLPSGPPPLNTAAPPPQIPTSTPVSLPIAAIPPLALASFTAVAPAPQAASISEALSAVTSVGNASAALTAAMAQLARMVAEGGDDIEDMARERNRDDPTMWFLYQKESTAYKQYRDLVARMRNSKIPDLMSSNEIAPAASSRGNNFGGDSRLKKKRSRWGDKADTSGPGPTVVTVVPTVPHQPIGIGSRPAPAMQPIPLLTKVTRTDSNLLQYALKSYGTTQLTEEDWKKCEDHYKVHLLYHDMLRKREQLAKLERAGKHKYEYDSDEETEGGTWEHKLRSQEMEATERWADELTRQAEGKHHIGDFLPPNELEKFMEKYNARKEGREPDLSDYKEYKLKEDNIGFKMLQKLGWSEGQGLGSEGQGITDPINKATVRSEAQGLGLERPEEVAGHDDEYEAYRKRMMLAYRFRPNPLNNPRRSYY